MLKDWIKLNEWHKGIESPNVGIADMRHMDIESIPGCIFPNKIIGRTSFNYVAPQNFTVDAGGIASNYITLATENFSWTSATGSEQSGAGVPVLLTTTGTLPAPLVAGTIYFLKNFDYGAYQYNLATSFGGSTINITDSGTGVHTITMIPIQRPKFVTQDSTDVWLLDDDGRVWKVGSNTTPRLYPGNTLTGLGSTGDGIVYWKGYIFIWTSNTICLMNTSTGTWTNDWEGASVTNISSSKDHFALVGQDDIVYFCNGATIGSIQEDTTFDPADTGTYTINSSALDLPSDKTTHRLAELGKYLVVATDGREVYLWDRVSSSFELPLLFPEEIKSIIGVDNLVYVLAGQRGNGYVTDGVNIKNIFKIPEHLTGYYWQSTTPVIDFGGMERMENRIFFGVGNSIISSVYPFAGVWSYNIETKALKFEHAINSGDMGSGATIEINLVLRENGSENLLVFYTDGDSGGVDYYEDGKNYSTNERTAYVLSPLYPLGTAEQPMTLQKAELEFIIDPSEDESFSVYYRNDIKENFTLIKTVTTDLATNIYKLELGHITIKTIQFKITLDSADNSDRTKCLLREFRFK